MKNDRYSVTIMKRLDTPGHTKTSNGDICPYCAETTIQAIKAYRYCTFGFLISLDKRQIMCSFKALHVY